MLRSTVWRWCLLQEMFEEYQRGLAVPGTPIRTFRLRVLLFSVVEVPYSVGEPFTPEEIQDGHDFFARSRLALLSPQNEPYGPARLRLARLLALCSCNVIDWGPEEEHGKIRYGLGVIRITDFSGSLQYSQK